MMTKYNPIVLSTSVSVSVYLVLVRDILLKTLRINLIMEN